MTDWLSVGGAMLDRHDGIVRLTRQDMDAVQSEAAKRIRQTAARNAQHDTSLGSMPKHLEGAGGECALWRFVYPDRPWRPAPWREPDVPPDLEARTTMTHLGGGDTKYLTLREKDPTDRRWVLLWGRFPGPYLIIGWIQGVYAKQPRYLRRGPGGAPIYAVPERHLYAADELAIDRPPG